MVRSTLSIVAMRLRLVSFSGASDSITFQGPLNSSISAMSFRISGVIVTFLISCARISIYTRLYPFGTRHDNGRHSAPAAGTTHPSPRWNLGICNSGSSFCNSFSVPWRERTFSQRLSVSPWHENHNHKPSSGSLVQRVSFLVRLLLSWPRVLAVPFYVSNRLFRLRS
jgi:hypothetical protein